MPGTGSRSGYDSASERAQGQTKKAAGKLVHDEEMEQEGTTQEAEATAKEEEILEPWERLRSVKENEDQ